MRFIFRRMRTKTKKLFEEIIGQLIYFILSDKIMICDIFIYLFFKFKKLNLIILFVFLNVFFLLVQYNYQDEVLNSYLNQ